MNRDITTVLKNDERAIFELCALYDRYGYTRFKMSKFEEYDLYVRNKNFLLSDHVITFTDTTGKLMALKPDVTLSIVKNSKDTADCVQKVYYHENVYRVPKSGYGYREIAQVGLECIGAIDTYAISEVLALAIESLAEISDDFVLDVSHMGVLSAVLDGMNASGALRKEILSCVGEKNLHGIDALCEKEGIAPARAETLKSLVSTYGPAEETISSLLAVISDGPARAALLELQTVISTLGGRFRENIRVDFSVINDLSYYNGIVFKGFVNGIPTSILSGGQYDLLMQKMGKRSGAIGFAVYPDSLGELTVSAKEYDVDAVLLYDADTDPVALCEAARALTDEGKRIAVQRSIPEKLTYKQLLKWTESGVETLENHA